MVSGMRGQAEKPVKHQSINQNSFADYLRQDRRLLLLRLLARQVDFTLNDSLLLQGLDQLGHGITRRKLLGDLQFLQQRELVECWALSGQLHRVCLLTRGWEVARGKCRMRGIRQPAPDEIAQDSENALEEDSNEGASGAACSSDAND